MRTSARSEEYAGLIRLAQVAGLVATGWFIWTHSIASKQNIRHLLSDALVYALITWTASAVITLYVQIVISPELKGIVGRSIRTSAIGMWFAPSIILLSSLSPSGFLVSLILATNTTRLLVSRCFPPTKKLRRVKREFFPITELKTSFLSQQSVPALVGSVAIVAGAVAFVWGYPLLSAALLVASSAVLTALCIRAEVCEPAKAANVPSSILSILLTVIMAATLSVGGLEVGGKSNSSDPESPREIVRRLVERPKAARTQAKPGESFTTLYVPSGDTGRIGRQGFPGVILRPEAKPQRSPVFTGKSVHEPALSRPQTIEFSGEYWMFEAPWDGPPANSLISRESPSGRLFYTVDAIPMAMEAHQKLTQPIERSNLSAIQVVISSADNSPGAVALELILIDRSSGLSQTLGTDVVSAFSQTLLFSLPRVSPLRQFDEMKIVYHRDHFRADKSARIAIERFVLAPAPWQ